KVINTKVSRERIGIEVDKMIKGPHPALSIKLIHELGLYDTIFAPPQDYHGTLDDSKTAVCLAKILEWLLLTSNENHLHMNLSSRTPEDIRLLYLASFLAPHKNIEIVSKKKNYTSFHHVIKESLRLKSSDADITKKFFSFVDPITTAANRNLVAPLDRKSLGLLIRDIGSQWQNAFILALILKEPYKIIEKYNKLVDLITELGLLNCFNDKPIINGKELATLLNIKQGVIIGEIQKSVIEWQLANAGGSKKWCEEYIKNKYKNI
ncbi:31548_t:CDS:2, partial [Racocetra persica]